MSSRAQVHGLSGEDTPLIGREEELDLLREAFGEAVAGRGRLFFISGESGMGKTRLGRELATEASRRAFVAWGRGWEGGGAPPLWLWTQVVREVVDAVPHDAISGRLRSSARLLSRFVPELDTVVQTAAPSRGDVDDRFELFDAVTTFLKGIAGLHALVLILDDLQWADEASLHLLSFLSRSIGTSPILVVGLFTSDAAMESEHRRLVAGAARHGWRLDLQGLPLEGVGKMMESMGHEPPTRSLLASLWDATQGNPLFVREAARLLARQATLTRPDRSLGFHVPEALHDVLERRLEGLSPDARRLLVVASVIGRRFDVRTLSDIGAAEPEDIVIRLAEAVERGVAREVSTLGKYTFAHPLLRELLYEQAPVADRMRLHREIAEALEHRYHNDIDRHLSEIAHHFFKAAQATDQEKAIAYSTRAAEQASALTAYEEAARLYDRALKLSVLVDPTSNRTRRLGLALADAERRAAAPSQHSSPGLENSTSADDATIVREGDYWSVSFAGNVVRLKDSKGLRYLVELLRRPGTQFHALDLVTSIAGASAAARGIPGGAGRGGEVTGGGDDAGELLDAQAKAAYKKRLIDLHEELAEAETNNDLGRVSKVTAEIDILTQQLAAAVGLGGRDRRAASHAERARTSVSKALKTTIARITDAHPKLGAHLAVAVRTGIYCSYMPDPAAPVRWSI